MRALAENLWLLRFPLGLLGCKMGRNVTVIRLGSGDLVLHSTAPFTEDEVAAISRLGAPRWLVEGTLFHDTYASEGQSAFPELPYLAPPGMPESLCAGSLHPAPVEWKDELEVFPLGGMPKVREMLLYHRPSATLILADLFFNLSPSGWSRVFLRVVAGISEFPAMSRLFRLMIKDREAFRESLEAVRALPIERIVVGHGEPIEQDARRVLDTVLEKAGF